MAVIHQEAKRPPVKTSRQGGRSGTSRPGNRDYRQHGLLVRILRACPVWTIWAGMALIAAAYIFLFYYFLVSPFSFRWRGIYGNPPYPEGYDIRGIDISHYQGRIDWERLRNADVNKAPIRFIFIKATEGEELVDENFGDNFLRSRENCFITGAYHFYNADADPRRQAEHFIRTVKLSAGDLPPVLDVEKRGGLPLETFRRNVLTWLRLVEQHYGVKPVIYTGLKFRASYLSHASFDDYPFWIAHYYVEKLSYTGPWTFWQHTDGGKVDGIRGKVDLNIYNGSLSELMKITIPEKQRQHPEVSYEEN